MRNKIACRRVLLKNVMLDAGTPPPAKIRRRPVIRRMSLARRLEKLHRLQAIEPPRSRMGV
jgi:hypothetical protein